MTPTDKMEMQISESQDGSATIVLPEDMVADLPNDSTDQAAQDAANTTNNQQDDDNTDDDWDSPADAGKSDAEREAIRAARREERRLKKQLHREKARESNHLINALRKQNQELSERIAKLETKTSGAELARVDKAIDDASTEVEFAKMKMQEAIKHNDGVGAVKAQELLYESQRKLESLRNVKEQATKQMSQPQQNIQAPDQMVQVKAADWMERNPWYDPQGRDSDSAIAQTIDRRLTEEGFDPGSDAYWDELDARLQKYLPHRTNQVYNEDNSLRNQRPKSVVTSSGRDGAGQQKGATYTLDPERVKALKEAGMWDNLELRNKMIKKFMGWDKNNRK